VWCVLPLLETALTDVNAAKTLYDNEYYPQAMFLLQQAIEKGLKAVYVQNGIIACNEIKNKVSHFPLKALPKILEKHLTQPSIKLPNKLFESVLQADTKFFLDTIGKLEETLKRWKEKPIHMLLNDEKVLNDVLKTCSEIPQKVKQTVEQILERFNKVLVNKEIFDVFLKIMKIKPEENLIQKIGKILNLIKPTIITVFQCTAILLALDAIFEQQVEITRYPKTEKIGPKIYTKNKLLVKKFPKLCNMAKSALEKLYKNIPHNKMWKT